MTLIKIFAIISGISMMFNIYIRDSLDSPKGNPFWRFMGLFRRAFSIDKLFPLGIRGNTKEQMLRRRANFFLLLFWLFFLLIFVALIFLSYAG